MTTPNKGLAQPATGSLNNAWGPVLNSNAAILDTVVGGTQSVSITSSNVTLSSSEALNLRYVLTGTLTGNRELIWPQVGGIYVVQNDTAGAFTVTLRTSAVGDTVVIPQGTTLTVSTDGTDMVIADTALAGGQLSYAVDTGAADAYVIAPSLPVVLKPGATVVWAATNANTGASTLNASGTGATAIKAAQSGADPGAGEIAVGGVYVSTYNGTAWRTQGIGFLPTTGGTIVGNITLQSNDAGASAAPTFNLFRNSATPAANDVLGEIPFTGKDSGGGTDTYARVYADIVDPTATSEDGRLNFETKIAGTAATRGYIGAGQVLGAATGGDKGAGTLNLAAALYLNGLLTSPFGPTTVRTASSSPELDYVLDPTLYSGYLIEMINVLPATDAANPQWLVSIDGGSNFITTGTYSYQWLAASLGSATAGGTPGAAFIDMITDVGNVAGEGVTGFLYVGNGTGAGGTTILGAYFNIVSTGNPIVGIFGGRNTTSSTVNALRFKFDTGAIASGSIRFRPLLLT